jgi:hypothetical protein
LKGKKAAHDKDASVTVTARLKSVSNLLDIQGVALSGVATDVESIDRYTSQNLDAIREMLLAMNL